VPLELAPARATAHANIALAKYWGKSDVAHNLPAVPSISLTLEELVTETEVCFEPGRKHDDFVLDGRPATQKEMKRAVALLDRVRSAAGIAHRARVTSHNRFPTAAGLASSASGFAALAAAATSAAGDEVDLTALSALARRSSASAARSIYGGFVELSAGVPGEDELAAHQIAPPTHWDVRLVVGFTAAGPKSVSSTEAMERSRATSPFYDAWVGAAPGWSETVKRAIHDSDLEALGDLATEYALLGSGHDLGTSYGRGSSCGRRAGLEHDGCRAPRQSALRSRERPSRPRRVDADPRCPSGPRRDSWVRGRGIAMTAQNVSAPGKAFLCGEYAVLSGAPAIVAAVSRRVTARWTRLPHRPELLPREALATMTAAQDDFGQPPYHLSVDTRRLYEGPNKLGLGSSAAVAAASAAALAALRGLDLNAREVRDRVFATALRGHSAVAAQGSGGDVAAATYGGYVSVRRHGGELLARPIEPPSSLVFTLIWTGESARTSDLLARVSRLEALAPKIHDRCMAALKQYATEFSHAFHSNDGRAIIGTVHQYNACMSALGVAAQAPIVTTKLRRVAQWAEWHGGAAKPCGAGGGDLAVAFFLDRNAAEDFAAVCENDGLTQVKVDWGAEGVRAHKSCFSPLRASPGHQHHQSASDRG